MPTQCITIDLADQGRRKVRAGFDGGRMSCDGGALLLRAIDQRIGLTRRLAACFVDHRDPRRCEHSLQRLLAQRLFGLALGYEDISDHDRLRDDSLLALALGSDDLSGERRVRERDRGHPLAGSSTLNRLELGTPEQARQDRYKRIVADTERIVGQIRQRWPRVRQMRGAGGRGLLPGRSDGVVRGAGGAGLRVRLGKEPAFEAGDRAAAAALAEPGAGHRTGLAAVPRFPLPDADELEPEAARGGQGRVAARRGAREQPALRGDQPGAGTERDAGAVRAAVLCARGHGEPDQGAAAGPVRGSHLGGDDAGEPVAAVLGAVRGGHAGGAAAARAGGDGAGAGAVRDDPGIAAEGGGRGAGERAQGLGVVVVGVSTAGAVRAQPFAAAGGGAGIAGGPAADAAGAPRAAPTGKVCPKSANAPSSRAQCPGTGPAGREIGLREGIPVRPRPQSNCRSAPDSLCHGPRRPQPKLPTLGERFGLTLCKIPLP